MTLNLSLPETWYDGCDSPVSGTPDCIGEGPFVLSFKGVGGGGLLKTIAWGSENYGKSVDEATATPCSSFTAVEGAFETKDVFDVAVVHRCFSVGDTVVNEWLVYINFVRYVRWVEDGEWNAVQYQFIFASSGNEPFFGEEDYCMWEFEPPEDTCCGGNVGKILSMDWSTGTGSGTGNKGAGAAVITVDNNKCCKCESGDCSKTSDGTESECNEEGDNTCTESQDDDCPPPTVPLNCCSDSGVETTPRYWACTSNNAKYLYFSGGCGAYGSFVADLNRVNNAYGSPGPRCEDRLSPTNAYDGSSCGALAPSGCSGYFDCSTTAKPVVTFSISGGNIRITVSRASDATPLGSWQTAITNPGGCTDTYELLPDAVSTGSWFVTPTTGP